jgi:hypothetical protein
MSKRDEVMVVHDRARICELLARGHRNRSEMARIINEGRPEEMHISAQQVGRDIKLMEEAYMERGMENLEVYRQQALDELTYLVKVYYESFERSRQKKVTVESMKAIGDEEEYDELVAEGILGQQEFENFNGFARDGKIKEESRGEGNPAFLNGIKACFDSINKIRGVDGANKIALTDPSGTEQYTGIADVMKARLDELSAREAPTDTQKLLLDASPKEDEDFIDVDAEEVMEEI